MPSADGDIVGDFLYIFGGPDDLGANPNNYKYNLITGALSSFEMPATIFFTEIPLDFIINPNEQIYKVDTTEDTMYMGFWNFVSGSDDDSFRVYASYI